MKVSKTENDIDKIKELKKHISKFESDIKALNKKIGQDKDSDEGDYDD